MTQINVAITVPTSDGEGKRPTGTTSWKPTKRRTVGDDVVLPAAFNVPITDPPTIAEVAPTEAGWAWEVVERVSGGSPHKRLLAVPDSPTVVDYADLIEVDPATLDPLEEPEAAWWAALANVVTVTPDPDNPNILLVSGTMVTADPENPNVVLIPGV